MFYTDKNSRIELAGEFDLDLLRKLFNAILDVNEKYIIYSMKGEDGQEEIKEHVERVFTYELYRQWANSVQGCFSTTEGGSLTVNSELTKRLPEDGNRLMVEVGNTVSPDMVLHASQSDDTNQAIACEIKRKANNDKNAFFKDFAKLSEYVSGFENNLAPFQCGVFILVGKNVRLQHIENKLNSDDSPFKGASYIKRYRNTFSQIICIAYDGTTLEYSTLAEALGR